MLESEKSQAVAELKENPLSEREMDVSRLLATGASNSEIARELQISPHTVKVHTRNIFEKLDVNSRTEASMMLIQRGWITLPGLEPAAAEPSIDEQAPLDPVLPEQGSAPAVANGASATAIEAPLDTPTARIQPAVPDADTITKQVLQPALEPAFNPEITLTEPASIFGWQRFYLVAALAFALLTFFIPSILSRADLGTNLLSDAGRTVLEPIISEQPRWRGGAPMLAARSRMAVAQLDDMVYVFGGETHDGRVLHTMVVYDLARNFWTAGETLPLPLANAAAVAVHDRIYVIGGSLGMESADVLAAENSTFNNKLLIYTPNPTDPTRGFWRELDNALPYREGIVGAALLAIEEKLYLIGGWDGIAMRPEIWSLSVPESADATLPDWSLPTEMEVPRAFLGAATLNGDLYVIGGFDGSRELNLSDIYYIDEKRWESLPPLLKPRGGLQLVSDERGIYALGGGWTQPVNDHERFDPNTRLWSNFKSPLQDRWRHMGAIIHNESIYVFGGWSGDYLNTHQLYDISLSRLMLPFMSESGQ